MCWNRQLYIICIFVLLVNLVELNYLKNALLTFVNTLCVNSIFKLNATFSLPHCTLTEGISTSTLDRFPAEEIPGSSFGGSMASQRRPEFTGLQLVMFHAPFYKVLNKKYILVTIIYICPSTTLVPLCLHNDVRNITIGLGYCIDARPISKAKILDTSMFKHCVIHVRHVH